MIITIQFKLNNNEIPIDYSPAFVSFIKHSIKNYDETFFQKYYVKGNYIPKNFTFALRFDKPSFKGNKIYLAGLDAEMIFHISDPNDAIDFYNSFIKQRNVTYPLPLGNNIKINNVKICSHKIISSNEIIIRMNSPLIVRRHEDNKDFYFSYDSEDFQKYFFMSVSKMLNSLYGINIEENAIMIEPAVPKKTVVTTFGCKITGNIGTYKLKGNPELLNILCQTGLCSRRNQGYGCFNVIREVI